MSKRYIEARDVFYRNSNGKFALALKSLDLGLGEIVFLNGRNGSGKSTWMRLLAGVEKPAGGTVFIDGCDTTRMRRGQMGKMVGYLRQNPHRYFLADTVWKEITFADDLKGLSEEESKRKAEVWLNCFDLHEKRDASISLLSRGEKQRLALATVLSQGTPYMMLDDPSENLDEEARERLMILMERLCAEKNVGFLVASQDEELLKRLANRILRVREGKLHETI